MRIKGFVIGIIITAGLIMGGCFKETAEFKNAGGSSTGTTTTSIKFPPAPYKEVLYNPAIINNSTQWKNLNGHDPSIFKDGNTYYTFSSDVKVGGAATPAIQIRKSSDMSNWNFAGYALNKVPDGAYAWTGAGGIWAPDIVKIGADYYLYYCASLFGKNQSYIGVCKSSSVEGPWTDMGEVIKSSMSTTGGAVKSSFNAIDPNIVKDKTGGCWLAWGSFWNGIHIAGIDSASGKLSTPFDNKSADYGKIIARRAGPAPFYGGVEGPYIIYNPEFDYYYLFVSYDDLGKNYTVRVGRSRNIEGPYTDSNGISMANTSNTGSAAADLVGNKLIGGYKFEGTEGWIGPGHNSVLNDGGSWYFVHHARGDKIKDSNTGTYIWPYQHVRKMVWSSDGWPMVSPERYAGETEQPVTDADISGTWQVILHTKNRNVELAGWNNMVLKIDGTGTYSGNNITWIRLDEKRIKIGIPENGTEVDYETELLPAWDWENWKRTIVFTGINSSGTAVWGKKILINQVE